MSILQQHAEGSISGAAAATALDSAVSGVNLQAAAGGKLEYELQISAAIHRFAGDQPYPDVSSYLDMSELEPVLIASDAAAGVAVEGDLSPRSTCFILRASFRA